MFREFGRAIGEAVLEGIGRTASRVQEATPLPADLLEDDDAYLVVFDAPGTSSNDVQVRFRDGEVLVRIDRFRDHYEGFDMRIPGRGLSLDGRVGLPPDADVDPEAATSTLRRNGTLEIRLPKLHAGDDEAGEAIEVADEAQSDVDG